MNNKKVWSTPPDTVELDESSVHVWLASLDQPEPVVQCLAYMLSEDERARAEKFHFAIDKRRFIVARAVLRRILVLYLKIDPRRLMFDYGLQGKPILHEAYNEQGLQFNVSHSHERVLFAITRR